ncbi:hypothetical protein [Xanthomonas medicagonis]|uniref:hypothetical protein n=1 Tax=Xanthomonas medicagonis TaxID=3160841 RepID=UPI003511B165
MSKQDIPLVLTRLLAIACAAALADASRAQVHPSSDLMQPAYASYARDNGVDEAEAARRLELRQVLARPEIEAFKARYADRLDASYWDDSRDGFELVLRLKQGPLPATQELRTAHGTIPVKFTLVSGKTMDEISAILAANHARLREQVPGLQGTGVDEVHATITLYVLAPTEEHSGYEARRSSLSTQLGVPVTFKFLPGPMESEPPGPA